MAVKKRIFNLLKPEVMPFTVWDKVYDWIMYRAKVIIMVTELLVVVAFAAKVVVDTTAKNKNEDVNALVNQVNFLASEKEPYYRKLISKDMTYTSAWDKSSNFEPILNEVYSYLNNPAVEVTININEKQVSIQGSLDLESLQKLETSMEESDTFSNAYIDNLTLESKDVAEGTGAYVLIAEINQNNKSRDGLTISTNVNGEN